MAHIIRILKGYLSDSDEELDEIAYSEEKYGSSTTLTMSNNKTEEMMTDGRQATSEDGTIDDAEEEEEEEEEAAGVDRLLKLYTNHQEDSKDRIAEDLSLGRFPPSDVGLESEMRMSIDSLTIPDLFSEGDTAATTSISQIGEESSTRLFEPIRHEHADLQSYSEYHTDLPKFLFKDPLTPSTSNPVVKPSPTRALVNTFNKYGTIRCDVDTAEGGSKISAPLGITISPQARLSPPSPELTVDPSDDTSGLLTSSHPSASIEAAYQETLSTQRDTRPSPLEGMSAHSGASDETMQPEPSTKAEAHRQRTTSPDEIQMIGQRRAGHPARVKEEDTMELHEKSETVDSPAAKSLTNAIGNLSTSDSSDQMTTEVLVVSSDSDSDSDSDSSTVKPVSTPTRSSNLKTKVPRRRGIPSDLPEGRKLPSDQSDSDDCIEVDQDGNTLLRTPGSLICENQRRVSHACFIPFSLATPGKTRTPKKEGSKLMETPIIKKRTISTYELESDDDEDDNDDDHDGGFALISFNSPLSRSNTVESSSGPCTPTKRQRRSPTGPKRVLPEWERWEDDLIREEVRENRLGNSSVVCERINQRRRKMRLGELRMAHDVRNRWAKLKGVMEASLAALHASP